MPAAAPRRTRQVAPSPEPEVLGTAEPEAPAALRRKPARAAARRVQAATSEEKVRLPADKRAVEVADGELVAPIKGRYFKISPTLALMPLMEFAAATQDVDVDNQVQLASLFRVLKNIVEPADWPEFRVFTTDERCGADDFLDFQNAAIEAMAARPTEAP